MGTKLTELRDGCFARAMDDEPMFVLLARDVTAPEHVEAWAIDRREAIKRGEKPSSDYHVVQEALDCAGRMRAWRHDNDGAWRTGLFGQDEATDAALLREMDANELADKVFPEASDRASARLEAFRTDAIEAQRAGDPVPMPPLPAHIRDGLRSTPNTDPYGNRYDADPDVSGWQLLPSYVRGTLLFAGGFAFAALVGMLH